MYIERELLILSSNFEDTWICFLYKGKLHKKEKSEFLQVIPDFSLPFYGTTKVTNTINFFWDTLTKRYLVGYQHNTMWYSYRRKQAR